MYLFHQHRLYLLPHTACTLLMNMSWKTLVFAYASLMATSVYWLNAYALRTGSVVDFSYDAWQLSFLHLQWVIAYLLYLLVFVRPRLLPHLQQALYLHPETKAGLLELHAQSARWFYFYALPCLGLMLILVVVLGTYCSTMVFLTEYVFTDYWSWFYTHAAMFILLMLSVVQAYWLLMYLCLKHHLLRHGLNKPHV